MAILRSSHKVGKTKLQAKPFKELSCLSNRLGVVLRNCSFFSPARGLFFRQLYYRFYLIFSYPVLLKMPPKGCVDMGTLKKPHPPASEAISYLRSWHAKA